MDGDAGRSLRSKNQHPSPRLQSLYRIGAAAALATLLSVLVDVLTSVMVRRADFEPRSQSTEDWFTLLQRRPLIGLRNLGLLNVLNTALALPMFGALLAAHWRTNRTAALVATALQFMGTVVYVAGNRALRMLSLSREHANAESDADRNAALIRAEAALARGEDFTPATFPGLFLTGLAPIAMSAVMLRGGVVPKSTAWTGIIGPLAILLYTAWVTFVRAAFRPALSVAALGGLATMGWYSLTARVLLRLARRERDAANL